MESRPFVFLHTPKAGGTSIVELLRINFPSRDVYPVHYEDGVQKHLYYDIIKRDIRNRKSLIYGHIGHYVHGYIGAQVDYGMAFRDPVERISSFFRFLYLDYTSVSLHWELLSSADPIETILAPDFEEHNLMTKLLSGNTNLREPATEDTFLRAKDNIHNLKVISISERMNVSALLFTKILDLRFPVSFHENQSSSNLPTHLVEAIRRREDDIRDLNSYDAQIYSMACEIFSSMVSQYTFSEEPIIESTDAVLNKFGDIKLYDLKMMFEFLIEDDKFRRDMLVEVALSADTFLNGKPAISFGLGCLVPLDPGSSELITVISREFYGRGHNLLEVMVVSTQGNVPPLSYIKYSLINQQDEVNQNGASSFFDIIRISDGYVGVADLADGIWGLTTVKLEISFDELASSERWDNEVIIERIGVYSKS